MALFRASHRLTRRHRANNAFIKRESYTSFKLPRIIRSRHDVVKGTVGPYVKLVEDEIYKLPYFIKHVPIPGRPKFIMDRLNKPGFEIAATDYSSFEALFSKEVMEAVEVELFKYMLHDVSRFELEKWYEMLVGKNVSHMFGKGKHSKLLIEVIARRMSGEMSTSLANGFTNLMVGLFLASRHGDRVEDGGVDMVVEGDDGLMITRHATPTPEEFGELGFVIKQEKPSCINEASFCKMVFDPVDLSNLADPAEGLVKFGWTHAQQKNGSDKVLKELLRAKALSLAYELPHCPILAALARYGMRVTEGSHYLREWDWYHASYSLDDVDAPSANIPMANRLLVEKKFGIDVPTQLRVERYLDAKTDISPLDTPDILDVCRRDWWRAGQYCMNAPLMSVL